VSHCSGLSNGLRVRLEVEEEKMRITLRASFAIPVVVALAMSCGSSPVEPQDLAGTYVATSLTFSGAQTGDFLAEGGSIRITLAAAGTTTGTMVVPASLSESGSQETLDLTGTFTVTDDIVLFNHDADTFLRDADWAVDGNRLTSMPTFGGTTLNATLTRQ